MTKDYEVRPYNVGDEEDIIELLKTAFPVWSSLSGPLEHWRWKFRDTPMGSDVAVAVSEGKVVGATHDIRFNAKIGSSTLLSQYGCDAVVDPDFRGMGVYSRILALSDKIHDENGVQFECGQSNNPKVTESWDKRGHVLFPQAMSYIVRIRDVDLHLRNRPAKTQELTRLGFHVIKSFNEIRNLVDSEDGDYSVSETSSFGDDFNHFWSIQRESLGFTFEKSPAYLNWRYCDPRGGEYTVKQVRDKEELLGFSVLETKSLDQYKEGYIMELSTLPGRTDVSYSLFNDAGKHFDDLGVNVVYYLGVNGSHSQETSRRCGFVNSQRSPNIVCNASEDNYNLIKALAPDQVYFGYGDTL